MNPRIVVLAKAPAAGRSKTRLCPPCTPAEAAMLAEAALIDTLDAVLATPNVAPVLALDGEPGPWLPPGVRVMPQRGRGLDERIACALADAGGPALLIGMDAPQVTPTLLAAAVGRLADADAVLGQARDGGWWALGVRVAIPDVVLGVPMSTTRTGARQHARLHKLGLRHTQLPRLRDVDTFADALAVAARTPMSRFAKQLTAITKPVLAAAAR